MLQYIFVIGLILSGTLAETSKAGVKPVENKEIYGCQSGREILKKDEFGDRLQSINNYIAYMQTIENAYMQTIENQQNNLTVLDLAKNKMPDEIKAACEKHEQMVKKLEEMEKQLQILPEFSPPFDLKKSNVHTNVQPIEKVSQTKKRKRAEVNKGETKKRAKVNKKKPVKKIKIIKDYLGYEPHCYKSKALQKEKENFEKCYGKK
ncbi:MAG TPA: hypothetical protein VEK38_03810 [Candidatus Bathyarchaeia archaeon]|nr:hypothetical protein [Candidatus Bathyarchaeia archaeon]